MGNDKSQIVIFWLFSKTHPLHSTCRLYTHTATVRQTLPVTHPPIHRQRDTWPGRGGILSTPLRMADGTAIDVCLSSVFSPHRPPLRVRYIAAVNRVNTAAMLPRKVEQRPLIDLSMLSGDVLEDIMIQLWLVDAQAPMAAAVSKSFRIASAGASQATASMDVCPARIPLGTNPSIDPDVQISGRRSRGVRGAKHSPTIHETVSLQRTVLF